MGGKQTFSQGKKQLGESQPSEGYRGENFELVEGGCVDWKKPPQERLGTSQEGQQETIDRRNSGK